MSSRHLRRAVSVALTLLSAALAACGPTTSDLKITNENWEPIDIGTADEPPPSASRVAAVLREGGGVRVQFGDMVEIRGTTRRTDGGRDEREGWNDRSGWIWIAFNGDPKGAFKSEGASFAAALIGRRQGDLLTFAASDDKTGNQRYYAGGGNQFPIGPWQHYQQMKPLAGDVKPVTVFSVQSTVFLTRVEITRVCKGAATQRRIEVLDDTPISIAQDMFRTHETREPRWEWVRIAHWEGLCDDGSTARFDYGPIGVDPPAGRTKGLDISQLFGPWFNQAWRDIPTGVQVSRR